VIINKKGDSLNMQIFYIIFLLAFFGKTTTLFSIENYFISHSLHQKKDKKQNPGKKLSFLPEPINCFVSGQIQEGFFHGRNLRTLNTQLPDTQSRFRHRMYLGFYCDQKNAENPDQKIFQAALKLHNMQWWQDQNSHLLIKYYRLTSKVPLFSFSDAWIKLYSAAINPEWKAFTHALKVGYFPYQLGRGVSLGFADEGGIKYLGFELSYDPIESAYYCPAVLLQGDFHKNVSYELYGSILNAQYEPLFLNKQTPQPTLFLNHVNKEELNQYGKHLNRWIVSEKVIFQENKEAFSWRAEQYLSYLHSEYNFNDFQLPLVDRGIYAGTYGVMFDFTWDRWSLNIEAAGQFGTLDFFAINTSDYFLQPDSNGDIIITYDNVQIKDYADPNIFAMPIADPLKTVVNTIDLENAPTTPTLLSTNDGKNIFNLQANKFEDTADITLRLQNLDAASPASAAAKQVVDDLRYNLVQPIINAAEYPLVRQEKTLNLQGYFFMIDLSYACKTIPFTFNFAGGYLSGDKAPLISNDDQIADPKKSDYKGFIPLKENRYRGLGVKGFSFFTLRTIERPAGKNVHFNDISNLAFFGFGTDITPFKPDKKLFISNNILFFFQPFSPYILDENQNKTETRASSFAAVELNSAIQYRFLPQAELLVRGAFFVPQRLYRDMKNQLMSFMTIDGIQEDTKRANRLAYAVHIRLSYDF
jgi:hypothetical protein